MIGLQTGIRAAAHSPQPNRTFAFRVRLSRGLLSHLFRGRKCPAEPRELRSEPPNPLCFAFRNYFSIGRSYGEILSFASVPQTSADRSVRFRRSPAYLSPS